MGGNDAATKYFQSNGGSAALASKDPKTKYNSSTAVKYKEELKRRVAEDLKLYFLLPFSNWKIKPNSLFRYPEEVVVEGVEEPAAPADQEQDFFSSWDKPAIKRPTPPPTRTATPPVLGRVGSPGLTPGSNTTGINRPKSPLNPSSTSSTPPISRTTTSSAIRGSTAGATATKKTNILGAKKTTKLGAKKAVAVEDDFDFDAVEKKAKEEAERIEKLGYDPEDEKPKAEEKAKKAPVTTSPSTTATSHVRRSSDVERLGLSMNKLGFGQVVAAPAAAAAPKIGFGSTGAKTAAQESIYNSDIIQIITHTSGSRRRPLCS